MDVMDLTFPDDSFGFILCSHVLGVVDDRQQAMRELARVLQPDGVAILLWPISVDQAVPELDAAGFSVFVQDMRDDLDPAVADSNGIFPSEALYICRKRVACANDRMSVSSRARPHARTSAETRPARPDRQPAWPVSHGDGAQPARSSAQTARASRTRARCRLGAMTTRSGAARSPTQQANRYSVACAESSERSSDSPNGYASETQRTPSRVSSLPSTRELPLELLSVESRERPVCNAVGPNFPAGADERLELRP